MAMSCINDYRVASGIYKRVNSFKIVRAYRGSNSKLMFFISCIERVDIFYDGFYILQTIKPGKFSCFAY